MIFSCVSTNHSLLSAGWIGNGSNNDNRVIKRIKENQDSQPYVVTRILFAPKRSWLLQSLLLCLCVVGLFAISAFTQNSQAAGPAQNNAAGAKLTSQDVLIDATVTDNKDIDPNIALSTDSFAAFLERFANDVRHQWSQTSQPLDVQALKLIDTTIAQVNAKPNVLRYFSPSLASNALPRSWLGYLNNVLDSDRINRTGQFMSRFEIQLRQAESKFGAPAEIIAAIMAIETRLGKVMGNYRVLEVLLTLAYDYPLTANRDARRQFFYREALHLMQLARQQGREPLSYLGSYAGAIGIPQFMPSSIARFALDFDGNQTIDLSASVTDALGSVGNFLQQHGWQPTMGLTHIALPIDWQMPSELTPFYTTQLEGRWIDWSRLQSDLPPAISAQLSRDQKYTLISLPLEAGSRQYYLVNQNYFVITQYNRSFKYASSVGILSQRFISKLLSTESIH